MTAQITRQPQGAPGGTGGEFATKQNTPPEGTLTESATGSFAFPPNCIAALDDYLEFFETAPISDRILSNAGHAYRKWHEYALWKYVDDAYAIYGNDPEVVEETRKNYITGNRKKHEFLAQKRMEAAALYPIAEISHNRMRAVLRAHQILVWRGLLSSEEDAERATNHLITISGETKAAHEIAAEYRTTEWARRAFTDSDLAALDAMEAIASSLAEQTRLATGE